MQEMKDNETISLKKILVAYFSHWRLIVLAFVISAIPAVLYLLLYPRTYEMMARIQIQEDREMAGGGFGLGEAAGLMKSFGLGGGGGGTVNMDDELSTLTSNRLLKEMVLALGVNVEYTEPYSFFRIYNAPIVVRADSATNAHLSEVLEMKIRVDGKGVNVFTESGQTGEHTFTFTSLPGEISLPTGRFIIDYAAGKQQQDLPAKLNVAYRPAGWVAEDMAEDFTIEEVSQTSNMIELSCSDHEKMRGVDMLNTLIACYNDESYAYKKQDNDKMLNFLDGRIDTIINALRVVEGDIAVYKGANSLTDIESDVKFYAEQMKELQVKLIELESQANVIRMMDEFIKDPANKYSLVPVLLSQDGEKSGPVMAYNELLLERARVIQNSSMLNPLVGTLTEQVDKLRESVYATIDNAQRGAQLAIAEVKAKEKQLLDMKDGYPEHEKDFYELKRQQEILQGVYLILLQKREEIALNGGLDRKKARIIDDAFVKSRPIGPRKLYAAILMMFLTIAISVGYLFCKEELIGLMDEFKNYKHD